MTRRIPTPVRAPRPLLCLAAACLLAACASPAAAEKDEVPARRPTKLNRSFFVNPVSDFEARFESESREIFRHREAIVETVRIEPGMTVADVGTGTGFMAFLFAREVGPQGRVYAQDVVPAFVENVQRRAEESGLPVQAVLGDFDHCRLPAGSCDRVFICDTYHHFDDPLAMMRSIRDALRPEGQVVLVDFRKEEHWVRPWILGHVRPDRERVLFEVRQAGFRLVDRPRFLDENYLLRFEKIQVD